MESGSASYKYYEMNIDKSNPPVCIAIPVYKDFNALNSYEIVSLTRCFKILSLYSIFFIGHELMDWSGYQKFCIQNGFSFNRKIFSASFFEDIQGYNRLMMSIGFYSSFPGFEYVLIYQTDCFVFRDELTQWCRLNYDYIGAPWIDVNIFEWILTDRYPKKLAYVHRIFRNTFIHKAGNGGLSLRKISSLISNLKRFSTAAKNWRAYEDSFFSHYIGTFNPFFRIPGTKTALKFSFDAAAEKSYRLNHNNLPFACHGWFRNDSPHYEHNRAFWEPIIQNFL